MANKLAENNIPTALIPECAIYAMMSKVNKVLLGNIFFFEHIYLFHFFKVPMLL
jgi:translation initiation factor 2B subunit (eIF-2B alpha/beta/delta family)